MLVTCWGDQPALRVHVRDAADTYAEVNLPTSSSSSGARVTGTWVMLTVTVTPDSLKFYVDGLAHPGEYSFGRNWGGRVNVADPDPAALNVSLTTFNLGGVSTSVRTHERLHS